MKTSKRYCLRLTLFLFLILIFTIKINAQLFLPKVDYSASFGPTAVAIGDFNGDNKSDLAVANQAGFNISILLGNGDGTFQNKVNYATGSNPYSVSIGDLNGDNKYDLVVSNSADNNVSVLLGNGDGTFQNKVDYATGSNPRSLAIGDFNGDNKLDLSVTNSDDNNVSILLGNGDGTFQNKVNYATRVHPYSVAIGDFNRDNKLDLAIANDGSDAVCILLGNGNGTFQNKVDYTTGQVQRSVAIGDFNGDNKLDLVVANYSVNTVSILLGIGDGTFQNNVDYITGTRPYSIAIGDFSGDNKSDLAVTNYNSNTVSILLGNGDGTFQNKVDFGTRTNPFSVAIGNFDGDNKSDLAVTNYSTAQVSILIHNNNLPTAANGSVTINEDNIKTFAASEFNYTDADNDPLSKIQITSLPETALLFKDANLNSAVDVGEIILLNGEVTKTEIDANKLKFEPALNQNGSPYNTFNFKVHDGTAYSGISYTMTINVNAVNDVPVFTKGGNQSINEDSGAHTIAGWATGIGDGDPELTQTLTFNVSNDNNTLFSVQPSINASNGNLTYTPVANANGSATVTVTLSDDGSGVAPNVNTSAAQTFNITINAINDAPVLAAIENAALSYTEGDAATAVTGTITASDVDDTNIENANVQITGNYQNGQDVLNFTNQNGITGTWTAATGTMALSGSSTKANYQTALRDVKYNNTSDNPSTLARTVSFTINDGDDNSNTQTRNINVTAVNDAPVLAAIENAALSYTEGDAATAVTSTITANDVNDTDMESATIQITGNYQNGQDVLSFTNQNGITGTWTAATGTMALSGSSTKANYQTALRDVKYNNTSDNPSTLTRTVSFTVNDGDINSNTLARDINITAVDDAPVLAAIENAALSYTEGDAATAVTSTITVSDVDDTNIESAAIQITGNYQKGQDVLSFTNQNGITGTWTAATGTMALSGSATKVNYQTALRDVNYRTIVQNPSTLQRIVSFTINDGENNSNTPTRQINVTVNSYTLTVISINGTVTKNPDQTDYNFGTTVTLTATPNVGYSFTGWSGDATGTTNPLTVTMDGNKNITANFTINTYTLTITATNGTVTKNPDQSIYNYGTTVEITAIPNVGFSFTGWSGDATGSTNPLTVTMDGNKNITANFIINTYTLTIISVNGTVVKNPDQSIYNYGTTIQITATPNVGYTFTGWGGNASGSTNPLTVTMDGNKNITANFTINTYTLTITSVNGTVIKNPNQTNYNHGSTVQLTATPNVGYTFTGWSGDATGSTNPLTVTMDGNKNITANFTINTYTLTITSVNGTVIKNPNQTNYNHGSTVQLTATPNVGYTFAGWSGDATGSTNPLTVTMDGNKNITANFTINTYTLTITSVNGTVVKNPEQSLYNYGTTVQLTATPNLGFTFTGWSGDESGTTNPLSIIMNCNKNITANFTIKKFIISGTVTQGINPLPNVTVTFSHDEHREQTSENGTYSYTVDFGTITTVTPTKSSYTFSPICMNYYNVISDQVGNYSATPLISSPVATEPTSVTQTSFNANWELSKDAIGYKLDVATDINFTNFVFGYRDLDVENVQTKVVNGLNSQTAYYYRVRAYSTDGAISNSSNTVGVITLLPQAPSGISISFNSNGNVVLQWVYNEEVKWFYIYREGGVNGSVKTNFVMTFTLIDSVAGNVKAYTDTIAVEGANYIYCIVAVSSNGATSGIGTEGATGTPITAPLKSPKNLTAIIQSDGKVLLSWECNSSIEDGCAIERSENTNTSFSECGKANVGIHTFIDDKVIKGIKYYYRTAAFKGTLKSAYSNEVSVTAIISDIKEINDGIPNIFSLSQNYPNPFNPFTKIKFGLPENSLAKIIIYDILGREVTILVNQELEAGYHEIDFNASNLSSGVYFYRMQTSDPSIRSGHGFTESKKMILMK